MPRSPLTTTAVLSAAIATPFASAAAQRSDLAVSPFVAFLPSTGSNPLAGLALTLAGDGGLGIRASAHLALENSPGSAFSAGSSVRPWGADADAILSIGRHGFGGNHTFAPFVFAGIGTAASDSAGYRINRPNWSYGAGTSLPLGRAIDLFGEARWRMSRYVLPTAAYAPSPTNEIRIGLSFHVGGNGPDGRVGPRDRRSETTPSVMIPGGRYPASTTASTSAARLIGIAEQYIGVPYRYGGTSPSSGFDCSGFVQYVFAQQGVRLPRTSREQAQVGESLSPDWRGVTAGDLVMFEENGRISHVAIYAGRNRIIHSSSSGGGVRYDDLSTQRGEWFVDHMVAARRVTPDPQGFSLDLARSFANGIEVQLDGPDHAPKPR